MVGKAVASVVLALAAMILVFFVYKNQLPYVQDVPNDLIYVSLIGVLIYIGGIAATKVQEKKPGYTPLKFIPEYMLRLAEAPVFMTVIYALVLQQNGALNQKGTLLALSLFIGMFTRNFEEFFKLLGKSLLDPIEKAVSK
jgi:hypothetical protein